MSAEGKCQLLRLLPALVSFTNASWAMSAKKRRHEIMSGEPVLIYPDTNIWNDLCDQDVDAQQLIAKLSALNVTLSLSPHTIYELARNFRRRTAVSDARGTHLFSYLKRFLELGVPCTKEVAGLLYDEAYAFENHQPEIDPLIRGDEARVVLQEVEKLSSGVVDDRAKQFIEDRSQFAADGRANQNTHFISRKELKQRLCAIPPANLRQWLIKETLTPYGADILYRHLERMVGPGPTPEYASWLLHYPAANIARAVVRADLYSNWRCANRDSNPKDLMNDMLHVLQAMYCDAYVTGEKRQSEYAGLLLTSNTRVTIYKRGIPVEEFLLSVAT